MAPRCYIVPPHLLRAIASSTHNPESIRQAAQASLTSHDRFTSLRKDRIAAINQSRRDGRHISSKQPFVPQEVLRNLAQSEAVDEATRARAQRDLDHVIALAERKAGQVVAALEKEEDDGKKKEAPYRAVYDANHTEDEDDLPGKLIRAEGQKKSDDKAVNEAFDNVGIVLDFYKEKFQWKSIDNKNMDVISSVHFGEGYENAFWDPDERQMVYGDGAEFLGNFTGCIDVIGHEMTHAVTEFTSPSITKANPVL
ncbi:Extracellular metalloprotease [Cladobotryum mycophilum]|uniref:Extracellular metalloprotease n=1 Tax=Cladobotryum mycophilum TaxID=491253 RepID=A0ABR0S822_9HYPO